jgi:hypothetical protein
MMMHLHQGMPIGKPMTNGGGKGSAPATPDYAGAAQATAQGNKEAAIAAQAGNMINQYTPQGSVEYAVRGEQNGTPLWSQTVKLSPEQQAMYNQNQAVNQQLGNVAQQGVGYVQEALNKPLSFADMQALQTPGAIQQQASDAAYANATRYLDPQFQRQQASLENQLANQGITRGSEAWQNAMQESGAAKEQAYATARNQAYTQGLQGAGQAYNQGMGTRQQQITEAQTLQNNPINMLNAVRTGQQMQVANQPNVGVSSPGQMATTAGADLLGAASATGTYNQGLYNAQQAGNSAMTSGLFSLGAAAMPYMLSDRSAKKNVTKIGKLDNGLNLYRFEYIDDMKDMFGYGEHIGCMADEVENVFPDAVMMHDSGYKMVNYGVIYG